jgi:hypothetical protein
MNYSITFIHSSNENISHTFQPISDITSVNKIRNIVEVWSHFNSIETTMECIYLQHSDGRKIPYKTIQTKKGLGGKAITWDELFKRGGKIFD